MFNFGATPGPTGFGGSGTGGFFGGQQQQQPPSQQQQQPPQQPMGGLFGASGLAPAQQPSSVFGTSNTTGMGGFGPQPSSSALLPSTVMGGGGGAAPSLFAPKGTIGTSLLPTIAQAPVPFPKDTKFGDLPAEMRANLEAIEGRLRTASEQSALLTGRTYETTGRLGGEIDRFSERLLAAEAAQDTCKGHVLAAKRVLNQYWRYGEGVWRMLAASRQPTGEGGGTGIKWVPVITPGDVTPLEELIARMETQVEQLTDAAASLERQLGGSTTGTAINGTTAGPGREFGEQQQQQQHPVEMLKTTIKQQSELFLSLAGRVALMHEEADRMRSVYRSFLRRFRHDQRDPFAPRVSANGGGAGQETTAKTTTTTNPTAATTSSSALVSSATPFGSSQAAGPPPFPSVLAGRAGGVGSAISSVPPPPGPAPQLTFNGKRVSLPSATSAIPIRGAGSGPTGVNPFLQRPQ